MTAKWTRRGTYGSSGGEKWEAQIGNVECVVDGLGESWSWKVSIIEGKYREKQGEATTKQEAMKRAEKAAVQIGGAKTQESIESAITQLQDGGKRPSDIVRELIYGKEVRGMSLHEQSAVNSAPLDAAQNSSDAAEPVDEPEEGDIELPPLSHNQIAFFLDNDEAVAEFEALTTALDAAQIEYAIEDIESGETVITWPEDQNDLVDQTLDALGIEPYTEDERKEIIATAVDMIEAVVSGADAFLLTEGMIERSKCKKNKHPIVAASEMGESFRPGTVTHLESLLKKYFAKYDGTSVRIDFDPKLKGNRHKIIVTTPSATWAEEVWFKDGQAVPEFNGLLSQFHVQYKLAGKNIVIY